MAVLLKLLKKATVSSADLLAVYQKDFGEQIGSYGGALINSDRVPTGLFPLDLGLGGGFPRGRVSTIYGPESSNKTNIALRAIAMHQLLWPDLACVFVDVEYSFDPLWARQLGVDTERLIVLQPTHAEQVVDMVEGFLHTDDIGIVVIDSLAALVGQAELDASAEKQIVAGVATPVTKLVRKTAPALAEADKRGRQPTLIYINQIAYKVGVVFGDPEVMPGGKKPYHQSCLILRVYGKNVMDKKVSTVMPVLKEVKYVLKKWKCPVLSAEGKFDMVTLAHNGFEVGQCADYNTVSEYLQAFGEFEKGEKGKGWVILGEKYATLEPFRTRLYTDKKFGSHVRQLIIDRLLKEGGLSEEGGTFE
ncbi:hypothetical protein V3589_11255 [Sinorhizobium fredii]|uniref:hypothetical protein n=1 Tax=Rhizobium fredii TaxID=380 RepID=UPI0030A87A89